MATLTRDDQPGDLGVPIFRQPLLWKQYPLGSGNTPKWQHVHQHKDKKTWGYNHWSVFHDTTTIAPSIEIGATKHAFNVCTSEYIYICVYLDISVKLCMYVSLMSGAWGRMVGIIEASIATISTANNRRSRNWCIHACKQKIKVWTQSIVGIMVPHRHHYNIVTKVWNRLWEYPPSSKLT